MPARDGRVSAPRISVVVLTRDRPESLERCIRSILSGRATDWELIVLDNGGAAARRRTREWIAALPEASRIRLVESPPLGFARLRRKAFDRARGAIVMSLDDDCEAAPDALQRIAERFDSDARIGIVGGNLENVGFDAEERAKGRGRLGPNASWEPVQDPRSAELFGSANHSIRRKAYERVGGYDPFFGAGMEEADLALAVRGAGYRIVYDPAVRVRHHHLPQRFRARWGNLHRMRLYLFFKHLRPGGPAGWLSFAATEARLVLRDADRLLAGIRRRYRASRGGRARRLGGTLVWVAVEAMKIVWSRLTIPELLWRAGRARKRHGPRPLPSEVRAAGTAPRGGEGPSP